MTGIRKPLNAAEEDLVNVATRKDGGGGRCVPLGTCAVALPVCGGDQHQDEGYPHSVTEEGSLRLVNQKAGRSKKKREAPASGDESSIEP